MKKKIFLSIIGLALIFGAYIFINTDTTIESTESPIETKTDIDSNRVVKDTIPEIHDTLKKDVSAR